MLRGREAWRKRSDQFGNVFGRRMNIWLWLICGGLLGAFVVWRKLSLVPFSEAERYVQEGAWIVDVREPEEFEAGHLPEAVNFPLGGIPKSLSNRLSDRNQVILLHCRAGGRSALAVKRLRVAGYSRAYNLGSYSRAEQVVRKKT